VAAFEPYVDISDLRRDPLTGSQTMSFRPTCAQKKGVGRKVVVNSALALALALALESACFEALSA